MHQFLNQKKFFLLKEIFSNFSFGKKYFFRFEKKSFFPFRKKNVFCFYKKESFFSKVLFKRKTNFFFLERKKSFFKFFPFEKEIICFFSKIPFDSFRYMYCDEVQLEADTVLATLYVAKKYIVPHLARACVNYLETSLTAKNACLLLSQSRLFEEPDLMQRCWEVIDAQVSLNLRPLLLTMNDKDEITENIDVNHRKLSLSSIYPSLDIEFNSQFKNNGNTTKSFFNLNALDSFNRSCFLFDIKWNNCQKYSLYRDRNKLQFFEEIANIEVQNIFFRDNYAVLYKNIENHFQDGCDADVLEF